MTYQVEVARASAKALAKVPKRERLRIAGAIELLAVDPRPPGSLQLRGGSEARWRVRVGDYRIVYAIRDDRLVVLVLRIGYRREVYRR